MTLTVPCRRRQVVTSCQKHHTARRYASPRRHTINQLSFVIQEIRGVFIENTPVSAVGGDRGALLRVVGAVAVGLRCRWDRCFSACAAAAASPCRGSPDSAKWPPAERPAHRHRSCLFAFGPEKRRDIGGGRYLLAVIN